MRSYGHLNLQDNELQQAVLQVEANFPAVPTVGRLVFKDLVLYICIEINSGTPVWIPLTNEIDSYEHIQSGSSNQWLVNHNLNTTLPSVQVYGPENKVIHPGEISIVDNNNVSISFGQPTTGRAIVLSGNKHGSQRSQTASFEYTQTTPSAAWVVQHNLGYIPIVRIFVGNQEIFPKSITYSDNFQLTVLFDQAYVGNARLI